MSAPTAAQLVALRKATHTASKAFASYNFRQCPSPPSPLSPPSLLVADETPSRPARIETDFVRRTNQRFDGFPSSAPPAELGKWYADRTAELAVLQRASTVNKLFEGPKLVVERDGEIEVRFSWAVLARMDGRGVGCSASCTSAWPARSCEDELSRPVDLPASC